MTDPTPDADEAAVEAISDISDYDADPDTDWVGPQTDVSELVRHVESLGFVVEQSYIDTLGALSRPRELWFSLSTVHQNGKKDVLGILPARALASFVEERSEDWVAHPDGLGLSSTDGRYVELMVTPRARMRAIALKRPEVPFISARLSCISADPAHDHSLVFSTATGHTDRPVPEGYGRLLRWPVDLHLGNGRGSCVEISTPSATMAAHYYRVANGRRPGDLGRILSVKLRFQDSGSVESARRRAAEVASTLFFELSATGRISYRLHEPLSERRPRPTRRRPDTVLRFPPQIVDPRASSLFVGADDATSPLSTYLAYYQSIEYFLPFSNERSSIERLRREIFSPGFNLSSDTSLLGLANAIGKQASQSERESFQSLVALAVPADKALGMFETVNQRYVDHFSKRGQVKDISLINIQDKRLMSHQIADRIYDLRCRIVHSKVAGGPNGTEPLFPTDAQVNHLYPDIELVRLVAIEVITAFAVAAPVN